MKAQMEYFELLASLVLHKKMWLVFFFFFPGGRDLVECYRNILGSRDLVECYWNISMAIQKNIFQELHIPFAATIKK